MTKYVIAPQSGEQAVEDFFALQRGVNDNNLGKIVVQPVAA